MTCVCVIELGAYICDQLISRMNTWFSTAPFSMDQISVEPLSEDTARRYFIDLLDGEEEEILRRSVLGKEVSDMKKVEVEVERCERD